jgi:hypothetical protein
MLSGVEDGPAQHCDYQRIRTPEGWTTVLNSGGRSYQVMHSATGVATTILPQSYRAPAAVLQRDHDLLNGGWPLAYRSLLAQHGPVTRTHLAGHPVLRFVLATGTTVWLDPRTQLPVQEQMSGMGPRGMLRFDRWARLAPYTLPAAFFDPPHAQRSLWDRLTSWLHDHLK